jgi:MFS family permease
MQLARALPTACHWRDALSTSPLAPVLDPALTHKVVWRLAPLLILLYLANQLDRNNVGFAALTMNKTLGLPPSAFGLAAGLFYLGYVLVEVPSNLMMHRYGARRWLTRIMLTWGVLASLTAFVQNATHLYTVRFMLGLAEAGFYPGIVLYLTLWLPRRERVWLMSLFQLGIPLAGVFGAPLSTWLMQNVTLFGFSGWRLMLFLKGVPAIVLAGVVYLILKDRPDEAPWLTRTERAQLNDALDMERGEALHTGPKGALGAVRDRRVLALGLVYFGLNAGVIALGFFLPQMIAGFAERFNTHYSVFDIGMITAIPYAVAALSMLCWGRLARRTGVRGWHIAVPAAVGSVAIACALFLSSPYQIMAAFTVAAIGIFCPFASFWQLPSKFLSSAAAAAGFGLINSMGTLAGFLGPYATGWGRELTGSYRVPMLGVAAVMMLSAVSVMIMTRRGEQRLTQPSLEVPRRAA